MKPLPKQIQNSNSPKIETIINYAAIAMTVFAVTQLTNGATTNIAFAKAMVLMVFGVGLEYFKYYGRQKNLW